MGRADCAGEPAEWGGGGVCSTELYAASAKKAFRDITQGNNGAFSAGPGWDACSGQGSPVGQAVIGVLGSAVGGSAKGGKKTVGKKR